MSAPDPKDVAARALFASMAGMHGFMEAVGEMAQATNDISRAKAGRTRPQDTPYRGRETQLPQVHEKAK